MWSFWCAYYAGESTRRSAMPAKQWRLPAVSEQLILPHLVLDPVGGAILEQRWPQAIEAFGAPP